MEIHPWKLKKKIILVSDVDNGGGKACVWARNTWEIYVSSFQFIAYLKLLFLKSVSIFKILGGGKVNITSTLGFEP